MSVIKKQGNLPVSLAANVVYKDGWMVLYGVGENVYFTGFCFFDIHNL